jgi:hypothetical protein
VTLAVALDTVLALALVAAALAWLVRRAVRTFSRSRAGGCACPSEGACGPAARAGDLRAAAARGAAKAADRARGGDAPA